MRQFIDNPYPYFHTLRASAPICLTQQGTYLISRHDDVVTILRDRRFGRDFDNRTARCYGSQSLSEPLYRCARNWILELDPPRQERIRSVVLKAMSLERFEQMRPRIQQIIDGLIAQFEPDGGMDIIEDFAIRIPMTIICDLLGVPEEGRTLFYDGARIGGRLLDLALITMDEIQDFNKRIIEVSDYFRELIGERRRNPTNDLISALASHGELTEEELISNLILLFGAGYETTVHLIGNGILALYRNPIQLSLLRNDLSLIGNAIEEILRYDSPTQATIRVALEDVVDVRDTYIPKGRLCICLIGAAHRDPEAYPNPDCFDIRRLNVRPLSFGGGIHHCIGAALARMQGQIAISTILRRLPSMEIDIDDLLNPDWRNTFVLRGLNHLSAIWKTD